MPSFVFLVSESLKRQISGWSLSASHKSAQARLFWLFWHALDEREDISHEMLHGLDFRLILQVFLILPWITFGQFLRFVSILHSSPAWTDSRGLGTPWKGRCRLRRRWFCHFLWYTSYFQRFSRTRDLAQRHCLVSFILSGPLWWNIFWSSFRAASRRVDFVFLMWFAARRSLAGSMRDESQQ